VRLDGSAVIQRSARACRVRACRCSRSAVSSGEEE
jgi:hypothetical protein